MIDRIQLDSISIIFPCPTLPVYMGMHGRQTHTDRQLDKHLWNTSRMIYGEFAFGDLFKSAGQPTARINPFPYISSIRLI